MDEERLEEWMMARLRKANGPLQSVDLYWYAPDELFGFATYPWRERRKVVARLLQRMRRQGKVKHEYIGQTVGWAVVKSEGSITKS